MSSISWIGNKVVDPNAANVPKKPPCPYDSMPDEDRNYLKPSKLQNPYFEEHIEPAGKDSFLSKLKVSPKQGLFISEMKPAQSQELERQNTQESSMVLSGYQSNALNYGNIKTASSDVYKYIPEYLAENIGMFVRAEFILGANQYSDKAGRLIEVGKDYFVLEDVNTQANIMCDLFSVKFVTIMQM